MTWLSPERLWLLAAVAGLAAGYVVAQRRRSRYAVRFTNLRLLDRVAPKRPGWRRHVPAGLFLAMLGLLVAGFAQPQAATQVPRERATVMVAVDVSGSMMAGDVAPDRLAAARAAAHEFAGGLPEQFNVGLIAFGGAASVLVPPVTDRAALSGGIDRLAEGVAGPGGTAIGEAIAASLDSIRALDAEAGQDVPPARVVVLSDGANTMGQDPATAAQRAVELGIPVDSISFGTAAGTMRNGTPVPVDGQTLQAVADTTGGDYFAAEDADELRAAYADVGSSIGTRTEIRDVSARFVGAGLVLALLAALASLFWFARLP
ncbi:VWA domain-containing protein [Actinoplanes sp. G11-F43]|uniref:VWA domain-containing protein n=1 Tax=Actinoplanes sp. G11-F43 TaxID=3424130 RepID=UPI003D328C4E